jgi:hypothetical protein
VANAIPGFRTRFDSKNYSLTWKKQFETSYRVDPGLLTCAAISKIQSDYADSARNRCFTKAKDKKPFLPSVPGANTEQQPIVGD